MTKDEAYIKIKLWEAIDLIRTVVDNDNTILNPDIALTTSNALKRLQDNVLESLTKTD